MVENRKITETVPAEPEARKHVLLGGILLTAVLWVIGVLAAFQSYDAEIDNGHVEMENLGTRLAHHTSISIKNVDLALIRTASRFAKDWDDLTRSKVKMNEFLLTAFAGMQQLNDIMILEVGGQQIYRHRFGFGKAEPMDQKDMMVHMLLNPEKRLYIGTMYSADSIGLSRPIYDLDNVLRGYVVAKIRASYLKEIYEIGLSNSGHRFALYSLSGRIFSVPQDFPFNHNVSSVILGKTRQSTHLNSDENPDALTSHTKVPNYDLAVTAEVPYEEVVGRWQTNIAIFGGIAIAFSVFIMVAASQLQNSWLKMREEIASRRNAEIDLKKLSRAVEQSPASVLITDKDALIEYVNPKFTETSGYLPEEVYGKNPKILSANIGQVTDFQELWQTLLAGKEWRGHFCNRRKDGSIFWERASLSAIRNSKGAITNFLAVKEDVTQLKQTEDQLQLAAAVFEVASEAIMVCDGDNVIETVNTSFTDITGYQADEVVGESPSLLKSGRHNDQFYADMMTSLQRKGRWEGEIWNRRKNGEIYPQWLSIKTIHDEHGKIIRYISLFSDITSRKKNEERILYQANYDALTGLPNRSLFMDRLQRAVIRAERAGTQIALLFIDLDRFKNVNDTLGHAAGDLLLQEASRRLTSLVRRTDTVARLGGDEFTIIIQDLTDFVLIENLVEKLLDKLSAPYELDQNVAFVSASIGITVYPNDGKNVEELLKNADAAMYQAKDGGRNLSQFFTVEMNNAANERRALETALHQALEREEFVLHYQPIVDAKTRELISCEVLLRWHQPEHGNVFPDKFIPLAEDTGLIIPIGEWVLKQACREAMFWAKNNDAPPKVSVNLSTRQFKRSNVVDLISETLKATGLPANRLTLEITESLLIADDQSIIDQLNGIRELGCDLSIDDFGTGYSSLSYLRRFPITTLKIDRAFIMDLPDDEEAIALVSAILSMAQSLNLKVVAEGVETKEQLEYLNGEGCEFIQGYYFSPPLPIEAFRGVVRKQEPLDPDE